MNKTYTYTARSIDNPEQVVTFTLHDARMSVGLGAPLEHIERALNLEETSGTEEIEEGSDQVEKKGKQKLWLKPLAVSLVERGTRPFGITDVNVNVVDDWLKVKAWIRTGGLRLAPITLIDGRVDNAEAAHAFVGEVQERKADLEIPFFFRPLDYWFTWLFAGLLSAVFFQIWRRRGETESE